MITQFLSDGLSGLLSGFRLQLNYTLSSYILSLFLTLSPSLHNIFIYIQWYQWQLVVFQASDAYIRLASWIVFIKWFIAPANQKMGFCPLDISSNHHAAVQHLSSPTAPFSPREAEPPWK